jgi:hypothetical protein
LIQRHRTAASMDAPAAVASADRQQKKRKAADMKEHRVFF